MRNAEDKAIRLSPQQEVICDFVSKGRGSAFVEAVAGAGKTTTLIEALKRTNGWVAFAAYNAKIAAEIKAKIAKSGYDFGNRVKVGTFHSFGLNAWRFIHKGVQYGPEAAKEKARLTIEKLEIPRDLQSFVEKLVSLAKQRALGLHGHIDDMSEWYDIIEHFDLAYEIEDEGKVAVAVELAIKALKFHREIAASIIDFDDMIYMPVVTGCRMLGNDFVFVDEAQDTNPARRALARKMLKPSGRAIFVGDRHQAIYGFCHPAGVKILTPDGYRNVEQIVKDDAFIAVNASGDVAGWKGSYKIKETSVHHGWDWLLEVKAGDNATRVTPHHRLPVKVDKSAKFIVYMMKRGDKFRVGFMSAYANAGKNGKRFMLSQRAKMEKADAAWILKAFDNRFDAIIEEARLHKRGAFGGTMQDLTDEQVAALPQEPSFYIALLREHGRLADFPLWRQDRRQHFEANVPFITEACNLVNGMRVQVLGDWDERKRGRGRHTGEWLPVSTTELSYDAALPTYGITVPALSKREGYSPWPLYVADGIVVHNTGADADAIEQIVRQFNCKLLPLTITYRCPKAVVRAAQEFVSHIEAADEAPEGVVRHAGGIDIAKEGLTATDAILCRNTAPLVDMAYSLIAQRIACHVEGKDIGLGLLKLVNKFQARNVLDLKDAMEEYREKQVSKLMAKGKEQQADSLNDRIATLQIIADRHTSVDAIRTEISTMFQDSDNNPRPTLTLCTAHRSKGREWDRVFILGRHEYMPSKYARQAWQMAQEENLLYVAYTRAMQELVLA